MWLMRTMILLILMRVCNYQEDEKNQKILVGRLISSRDQCVNPYSSQHESVNLHDNFLSRTHQHTVIFSYPYSYITRLRPAPYSSPMHFIPCVQIRIKADLG